MSLQVEFMTHIITEICDYAVKNNMEPDDTLLTIADNIKNLLEITTFNDWERGVNMSQVEVMKVQGRVVNVFDDADFADLLRDTLGDDAARYFLDRTDPDAVMEGLDDSEILSRGYCSGECHKVQETQEHYEDLLKEIDDMAMAVYQKIFEGYQIGSSERTKKEQFALDKVIEKEQFALDKVIEIHRIVKRNT